MLKKIRIKKFKSIADLTINCNDRFNVIIGGNNVGKTSIFEAIHLWKMCYDWNMKKDKKGFYSNARNMPFKDMEYLRAYSDRDLFPRDCQTKNAEINICLTIELDGEEFELGFKVSKVTNIDDAYLQVDYDNNEQFKLFSENVIARSDYNMSNVIVINESRPIANIVVKEPYMTRAQVMEKMSKGKSYEVLRNKIVRSDAMTEKIANHLRSVLGTECKFGEVDKDTKTYIRLNVNGTNILSQGSGFLQIAEIFSSLEYVAPLIYILLIDEPDSHLHVKIQKRLISELRSIQNSQLFVITHNERFLADINEEEIRYITEDVKNGGIVNALPTGCKGIVLEDLVGVLNRLQKLKYAQNIMLLEGSADLDFFDRIIPKYEQFSGTTLQNYFIDKLNGIDTLHDKLLVYSRAVKDIVSIDAKWTVVRDNDCLPPSKQQRAGNDNIKDLSVTNKEIKFQKGYGLESTFIAEPEKFVKILLHYYQINAIELNTIKNFILALNQEYTNKVLTATNGVNQEFETHYNRQIKQRQERIYNDFDFRDVLREVNASNIHNIMTKKIMRWYLSELHTIISNAYVVTQTSLTERTIFGAYYNSINCLDDILGCHLELIRCLE